MISNNIQNVTNNDLVKQTSNRDNIINCLLKNSYTSKSVKVLKQSISHIFRHDIQKVFDLVKDFDETGIALGDMRSKVTYIRGKKTYEKGCYFHITFKNHFTIYMELSEIKETENEKLLIFKVIKTEPINIKYEIRYKLFSLTENNSTLLIWELIYYNPLEISKEQEEMGNKERIEILKIFSNYLKKKHGNYFTQTETIIINTPFTDLFNALRNISIFIKLIPCTIVKFELDGEFHKEGTNLFLECNNDKKYILKVEKSELNKEKNEFNFSIVVNQDIEKNKQRVCDKIQLKIIKIRSEVCFLSFIHYFDFGVEQEMIDKVVEFKKGILLDLKKGFENINKDV